MDIERRYFQSIECRAAEDGAIEGHAAVFNSLSEPIFGLFRERIMPGAFADSLKGDVRALWNHDTNIVLGRTKAGTLELREDSRGLHTRITPPEWAAGHMESIKRGDVTGMSFGFQVEQDNWIHSKGEMSVRELVRVNPLFDVSPVTFPAYQETDIKITTRTFLNAIGVDPHIAGVIAKYRSGLSVKDDEQRVLESSLNVLSQYVEIRQIGNVMGRCNCEKRGQTLGNLIGRLRDEADLTNEELGSAAGISASAIGQIIAGSIDCPPIGRLRRLARRLNVSVGRLISAAEEDGCDYNGDSDDRNAKFKQRLRRAETAII